MCQMPLIHLVAEVDIFNACPFLLLRSEDKPTLSTLSTQLTSLFPLQYEALENETEPRFQEATTPVRRHKRKASVHESLINTLVTFNE